MDPSPHIQRGTNRRISTRAGDFHRVPDVPWMIDVRVGLNVANYPRWFNNWVEGGHQPVWPETFARMPAQMRRLCTGRQAHSRDEAYESIR